MLKILFARQRAELNQHLCSRAETESNWTKPRLSFCWDCFYLFCVWKSIAQTYTHLHTWSRSTNAMHTFVYDVKKRIISEKEICLDWSMQGLWKRSAARMYKSTLSLLSTSRSALLLHNSDVKRLLLMPVNLYFGLKMNSISHQHTLESQTQTSLKDKTTTKKFPQRVIVLPSCAWQINILVQPTLSVAT